MLFIYLAENISFLILGSYVFHRKLNPFTIFILPWSLMVILYDMKLVTYYDLSATTYIILILTSFIFCFAVMLGYANNSNTYLSNSREKSVKIGALNFEKKLRHIILILTFFGVIPAFVSLVNIVRIYGFNFYTQLSVIYGERVLGKTNISTIPYMTSLVFIAITLAGIYFSNYGFKTFLLFPIISICIQPFTNGGRQFLIEGFLLFLLPFMIQKKRVMNRKWKIITYTLVIGGILLIVLISNQRSTYVNDIKYVSYATPEFEKIIAIFPGIYQIYTYISSPVGVLNAFLASPTFSFGVNSLFPFFGLLNRFGANIPVQRYQPFYYIPIQQNTGTAVKELIEDYHLFFALIIVLICGFFVGRATRKYEENNNIKNLYVLTQVFTLVILSFFTWMLRDANLIIALILGVIITNSLDKYAVLRR